MVLHYQTRPAAPARFLLQGVPRVSFYQGGERCPENVPLPACLRACLDYFGEGLGCRLISAYNSIWHLDDTYTFLMGASGCAFRLSWRPGWHADNSDVRYISADPLAPFRWAFEAAGYELILVDPGGRHDNEGLYREAVLRSLCEQGKPVLATGVIGPPECCLVTGYDENGDVLIGWNFFQDSPDYNTGGIFETSGEFRKPGWFANTHSLLIFGEKQPVASRSEIFHKVLRRALWIIRGPAAFGNLREIVRYNGIAAYQAWADGLLRDEDFLADVDVLRERFLVHDNAVGTVAEGRWYAAKFLELAAAEEPDLEEELFAAADCFEREHDLMWQIWGLVGGSGRSAEHARKLADPVTRRRIVPLILQAMEKDNEAAGWIEQACSRSPVRGSNGVFPLPG